MGIKFVVLYLLTAYLHGYNCTESTTPPVVPDTVEPIADGAANNSSSSSSESNNEKSNLLLTPDTGPKTSAPVAQATATDASSEGLPQSNQESQAKETVEREKQDATVTAPISKQANPDDQASNQPASPESTVTSATPQPAQTTASSPSADTASGKRTQIPKAIPNGKTKKCGNKDCSESLFKGRVVKDYKDIHSQFLSYGEGDTIEVNAIDFSDRTDLWEGELNGKRGMFYKNHIDQAGYYYFLHDAINGANKSRQLYVVSQEKKRGVDSVIKMEDMAVSLAKAYEVYKEKIDAVLTKTDNLKKEPSQEGPHESVDKGAPAAASPQTSADDHLPVVSSPQKIESADGTDHPESNRASLSQNPSDKCADGGCRDDEGAKEARSHPSQGSTSEKAEDEKASGDEKNDNAQHNGDKGAAVHRPSTMDALRGHGHSHGAGHSHGSPQGMQDTPTPHKKSNEQTVGQQDTDKHVADSAITPENNVETLNASSLPNAENGAQTNSSNEASPTNASDVPLSSNVDASAKVDSSTVKGEKVDTPANDVPAASVEPPATPEMKDTTTAPMEPPNPVPKEVLAPSTAPSTATPPAPAPVPKEVPAPPVEPPPTAIPKEVPATPTASPPVPAPEPKQAPASPTEAPSAPAPEPKEVPATPTATPPVTAPEPKEAPASPREPSAPAPEPKEVPATPTASPPVPAPEQKEAPTFPTEAPSAPAPEPKQAAAPPTEPPPAPLSKEVPAPATEPLPTTAKADATAASAEPATALKTAPAPAIIPTPAPVQEDVPMERPPTPAATDASAEPAPTLKPASDPAVTSPAAVPTPVPNLEEAHGQTESTGFCTKDSCEHGQKDSIGVATQSSEEKINPEAGTNPDENTMESTAPSEGEKHADHVHHDHQHEHGHSHGHGHSHAPPPPTFGDRIRNAWRCSVSGARWVKENARPVVFGARFILAKVKRVLPTEVGEIMTERDVLLLATAVLVFLLHLVSRLFNERSRRGSILKLSEHAELYEKYMVLKVENEKLRSSSYDGAPSSTGASAADVQKFQEKYEKLIREEREQSDKVISELKSDNDQLRQAHDLLDGELVELRRQVNKYGHAEKELRQHQREYDELKGRYDSLCNELNEYRSNFEREREKVDDLERRLAEEQANSISKDRYCEQVKAEMTAVQTLLNESRNEEGRLSEELGVKSEEVQSLKELITALKMTRSEESEKATRPKYRDDEGGKKSSESNGDWDLGDGLDEEGRILEGQDAAVVDLETKLAALTDTAKLRKRIKELEDERERVKKTLGDEYESKRKVEQDLAEMKAEYEAIKQRQKDAEQQAMQAQTRLQILEEFFQSKQTELQKQLGQHQVLSQQRSEMLGSADEKVKRYQDEKSQADKIADDLRRELKELERENSKLRQDADRHRHEAWLSSRRSERELEALRLEAAALRARVADMSSSGGKLFAGSEQRSPVGSTTGGPPADNDNNSSEAELAAIAARESPYLAGGGKLNKSATFPSQPPAGRPPYLPVMPSYPPPPMPPMHMPPPMDYPQARSSGHASPLYSPMYGMPPPRMDDYDDYRGGGPSPPMAEYRRSARSAAGGPRRAKSKTRSPQRSPSPPPEEFRRSGRRSEGAGGGQKRSKSKHRSPPRIPSPSYFRKY